MPPSRLIVLLPLIFLFTAPPANAAPLIADYQAVAQFDQIPPYWIEQAKIMFNIGYGHTSHGGQITTGLDLARTLFGDLYTVNKYNRSCTGTGLCYFEGASYGSGWLELDAGYWPTWRNETIEFLSEPTNSHFNVIMWSWCGQVPNKYASHPDPENNALFTEYLEAMDLLEQTYPHIDFIYMTGHLDGTGTTGNLNLGNEQIRSYVIQNDKILFDFADIESYDPSGNYYLDRSGNDDTGYDSNGDGSINRWWAIDWCNAHPSDPFCTSCSNCSHSYCIVCNMKGRAFWWLLARMAGWPGVDADPTPTPTPSQPPSPSPAPLPGDINGDGKVDIFDYNLLLQDFGLIGDSPADINSDGRVDIFDYNLLLQNFGS